MRYFLLKKYSEVSKYISCVSSVADKNKKSFGFLSNVVYEQMASKNQLWVAIDEGDKLKGYLMFGGTMPTIKIFQIYSCETARGHGIGRMLINSLKDHARKENYHTISARVASDLSANYFWSKVGFDIYRQVKGSEVKKRIINVRGFSLKENDLFGDEVRESGSPKVSSPMLTRSVYALDLNLLFDVVKARQGFEDVIKLMQIGFQGGMSLCVTPEFKNELKRQFRGVKEDAILRLAEAFPELRVEEDVASLIEELRELVFPLRSLSRNSGVNDESDLKHLACCVFLKIEGFVTREKALLKACDKIRNRYGVSIITPDELMIDEEVINRPLNSDFSFEASHFSLEIKNFLKSFLIQDNIFNKFFSVSKFGGGELIYEARQDGCLFGVCVFQKPTKATGIASACLYVDEDSPNSIAAIDHFMEKTLRYRGGFTYRLDFYIGKGQDLTKDTLLKKGFFKSKDGFVKIIFSDFLGDKSWQSFVQEAKRLCGFSFPEKIPNKKELLHTGVCFNDSDGKVNTLSWFDFETMISPRFIINPGRGCTLVAIRENYANGLIGGLTNQLSLLPSYEKLLLLEKAYFRSTKKASFFQTGDVVAFYVSGQRSVQEIIGFARITYSNLVTVDEATLKVDRQGVLSRDKLIEIADNNGKLHVFTFDNFLEFDRRVSFRKAKDVGLISESNLVSPEKLSPKQLKVLIREAFDE